MTITDLKLAQWLCSQHQLSLSGYRAAKAFATQQSLDLASALILSGCLSVESIGNALSHATGTLYENPTHVSIPPKLLELIPFQYQIKADLLPIRYYRRGGHLRLQICISNPFDTERLDEVAFITNSPIDPLVTPLFFIREAVAQNRLKVDITSQGKSKKLSEEAFPEIARLISAADIDFIRQVSAAVALTPQDLSELVALVTSIYRQQPNPPQGEQMH